MKNRLYLVMSVVLCIILVLSLVGCKETKTASTNNTNSGNKAVSGDAYNLYMAAVSKFMDASSNSLNMNMTFAGPDGENNSAIISNCSTATVYNDDKTDVKYKYVVKTDVGDFDSKMTAYYRDGFEYMSMNGIAMFKVEKSMEEALSEQGQGEGNEKIVRFKREDVIESKIKMIQDGTQVIFTIDPDFAKALWDNIPESEKHDGSELTYDGLTATAVIDKAGNLVSSITETKYTRTSDKGTYSQKITTTLTDIVTGGIKIDFPKDLEKYPDLESIAD